MPGKKRASAAGRIALLGLWCALAVALSFWEGTLPALPIPGARLGLSQLVTLSALSSLGLPGALAVTLVKAGFALFRGITSCCMSLVGGVISVVVMTAMRRLFPSQLSYIGISWGGAAAHNMGQLAVALVLLDGSLIGYAPWLLLISLVTGGITGFLCQLLSPLFQHFTGGLRV